MQRALVACLIVLGAVTLLAPGTALAGGPSAGDQQYIDPLAGSSHHHSGSSSTAPTTSPAQTSSSTPSASSSSTSSNSTKGSTTHDPVKGLPMTGFDALLVAFAGACLLASGVLLRRVARGR
jgi:hypothetical protein